MNKKFWTLDKLGNEVLRDLKKENSVYLQSDNTMSGQFRQDYYDGILDGNNYQWYEIFNHYVHDDNGCDYERYGCYIREGDVVLDLGANIGVFAHRAEMRGASKVISFEPMTPTFNCLIKNIGPKTNDYKMAVGSKSKWSDFKIHTNYEHLISAGSSLDKNIIHEERVYVIDINDVFGISDKIDFIKIDIEGGEVEVLNGITDFNLSSVRCLSGEFHLPIPEESEEFEKFQRDFVFRMNNLGFKSFILFHNGGTRTLTFWKE